MSFIETKFHAQDGTCIPVRSPLVSVNLVQSVLYLDAKKVMELVEDGRLEFAFDIRARAAGKILLRILTQSLADYVQKKKPDRNSNELAVYQSILPTPKISVSAISAARTLSCDADHIGRLIKEGSLKEFIRRDRRTQTAQIGRDCLLKFLRERRIV